MIQYKFNLLSNNLTTLQTNLRTYPHKTSNRTFSNYLITKKKNLNLKSLTIHTILNVVSFRISYLFGDFFNKPKESWFVRFKHIFSLSSVYIIWMRKTNINIFYRTSKKNENPPAETKKGKEFHQLFWWRS